MSGFDKSLSYSAAFVLKRRSATTWLDSKVRNGKEPRFQAVGVTAPRATRSIWSTSPPAESNNRLPNLSRALFNIVVSGIS